MKTWKFTIITNFIILCLCPFSKISHSFLPALDSESGTPLYVKNKHTKKSNQDKVSDPENIKYEPALSHLTLSFHL